MLTLIEELFRVDRVARAQGERLIKDASSEEDKARARGEAAAILRTERGEQSRDILGKIADKALHIGLASEPQSAAFKACATMSRQWEGLIRFVHNEQIPLHNNATEQSGRGPVLGRRTHQGSRSERGTEVAAILYTMCESAKLQQVDPECYMLLSVRRALLGKPPVTPSAVTQAMLIEDCELRPEQADAALSR